MNVFSKLNLMDLTENEKTLVSYIEMHPYEFLTKEVNEICAICFVSKSTIYRLCKKLGYEGCAMLKVAVSTSMKDQIPEEVDIDYPITSKQSEYEILHSLKTLYEGTVNDTLDLFDVDTLHTITKKMQTSAEINIYTSAGNVFFANNFKFQMSEINVDVQVPSEQYEQYWLAARSTPDKLAIIISFGGRGRYMDELAKLLKQKKTPIVLITSTQKHNLKQYADYVLYMASKEDHALKISSFGTRLSLLYILDSLYASFFKLNYQRNLTFKEKTYEIMRSVK